MFTTIYHIQKITTNTMQLQKNYTLTRSITHTHTHNTVINNFSNYLINVKAPTFTLEFQQLCSIHAFLKINIP